MLTRHANLMMSNLKFEEIKAIVRAYILSDLRTLTSSDTVETRIHEGVEWEMLNKLIHGPSFPHYTLILKKRFIDMLIHKLYPKKRHLNGRRYNMEDM